MRINGKHLTAMLCGIGVSLGVASSPVFAATGATAQVTVQPTPTGSISISYSANGATLGTDSTSGSALEFAPVVTSSTTTSELAANWFEVQATGAGSSTEWTLTSSVGSWSGASGNTMAGTSLTGNGTNTWLGESGTSAGTLSGTNNSFGTTTSPATILDNEALASVNQVEIQPTLVVPANQAPDTYSTTINFTATFS